MTNSFRTIRIPFHLNAEYTIEVLPLGTTMDGGFDQLYATYLVNEQSWPQFAVKQTPAWNMFTTASQQYFDDNLSATGTKGYVHVEGYFGNLFRLWHVMYRKGLLEYAAQFWENALEPVHGWERNHPGNRIHKGTPYYLWAVTMLLRGDTDQAFLLAHQALEEDSLSTGDKKPDLPAYAMVTLNHQKDDQALKQWVDEHAAFFDAYIKDYSLTFNRALTLDDVKRRFMDTVEVDTVFLLTYTIARLRKIGMVPDYVTRSSFAAQLQINLLFDLTLVIDSAIKAKKPSQDFVQLAENLLSAAHRPVQRLRDVNSKFLADFHQTLSSALDGNLEIRPRVHLDRMQCDAAVAYGLRNRAAHDVTTSPTISKRFIDVEKAIFRFLCAAIDHLY